MECSVLILRARSKFHQRCELYEVQTPCSVMDGAALEKNVPKNATRMGEIKMSSKV
jgi:hypothetical protein